MADVVKKSDLLAKRAGLVDKMTALAGGDTMTADQAKEFDTVEAEVKSLDEQITRVDKAQALAASTAQPVAGQEKATPVHASVENDPYVKDKTLIVGGIAKMIGVGGGNVYGARQAANDLYGESHPVTKALATNVGTAGGFIVPPDHMAGIIELLRARAVVRAAQPRNIPMPRGTMVIPGQTSAATANYGAENKAITASEPKVGNIVASYKKLTALVPVSNDMMRYADPSVDGFVRDDLVKVVGLREDLAFLLGDGTQDSPRGYTSFANSYALSQGGTAGLWSAAANSTAAVGGNFITSTSAYALATAAAELGGLVNKMDTANVPDSRRVWFMHPRTKNYLYNVQNALGVYVYRDELSKGVLSNYPVKTSTQIPINLWNADGSQKDCSFIILAEMDETMLLDSMQLELSVSRDASYVGADGNTYSTFQNDQTLIRAIAEHDFQLRHDAAVAVSQFVRWAPAIS